MAKSYKEILDEMCEKVTNCSTMEGSFIYTALMPYAMELADLYLRLELDEKNSYADTADYEHLKRIAKDRGLIPKDATYAEGIGIFDSIVPENSRFTLNTFVWKTGDLIERHDDFYYYKMVCETAGATPNQTIGKLDPITYVEGLTYAYLNEITIPGEDYESIESFRERYYASFNKKTFGGNKADYREKINSINGVGGCHIYPIWQGGGTVRISVINSEFEVPSETLIAQIQTEIDPLMDQGGDGYAPIGHKVTITPVENKNINVKVSITFDESHTFEGMKDVIMTKIKSYFKESLSKQWEKSDHLVVRTAQIQSVILNVPGVIDCTNLSLNELQPNQNMELGVDEIPNLIDLINV